MSFGVLRALAVAAAASMALSGCVESVATATPTPVNFKACLISSQTGFADAGINAQARYGLMQSEAQFGESISMAELSAKDSLNDVARAGRKLLKRGCGLIIGSGAMAAGALIPLANGNPKVRFAVLGYQGGAGGRAVAGNNFDGITYDSKLAYIQAGYLAAAKSAAGAVGVIARAGVPGVRQQAWFFRQGVEIFNLQTGGSVRVVNAESTTPRTWTYLPNSAAAAELAQFTQQTLAAGADVVAPLGVDGQTVASIVAGAKAYLIGQDSDWANETAFDTFKGSVLASVTHPVSQSVIDEVQRAMGDATATVSPSPTAAAGEYAYESAVTAEESVSWGSGVANELAKLASQFQAGTLQYEEYPQ